MARRDDDTVRLNAPRATPARGRSGVWPVAAVVVVAGLAGSAAWWVGLRPADNPPQAPAPVSPAVAPPVAVPAPPPFAPPLATEAEILADAPDQVAIYRFALQPNIIVVQFPDLAEQGRMLNRTAALVEKGGYPRDRVLPDPELNAKIAAGGDTPETFYYGHDYRAADLRRFFDLADAVTLTEDEQRLHIMLGRLGWDERGAVGALISLVRQSGGQGLDPAARATILRHELSHGLYFTDPAYAEFVYRFWTDTMNTSDRALFTAFLVKSGYDPAIEDLIINETQAYLMFTSDPRFFNAAAVGMPQPRIDLLRREFLAGMPPSWLRDMYAVPAATGAALPK